MIVGDLDCFFDYRPGEFCIIRNWVEWKRHSGSLPGKTEKYGKFFSIRQTESKFFDFRKIAECKKKRIISYWEIHKPAK